MTQRAGFMLPLSVVLLFAASLAHAQSREDQIVRSSMAVLAEVMSIPAKRIPQWLLAEARGVAIVPNVVKGGFVFGVRHGRGVMLIRDDAGVWQPPIFMSLTGGSVGWQAGIQATDVVMVFRTRQSIDSLMDGKLTIGVEAAASAGPIGRQASAATDARLAAEILSYSRSRGLFAGVSFDGSALQIDHLGGLAYYQGPVTPAGQPTSAVTALPPSAVQLINQLATITGAPRIQSDPQPVPDSRLSPARELIVPQSPRSSLIGSAQRLLLLLDDAWKTFLALPAEVYVENQEPSLASLQQTLRHYDTVAADPRYKSLARRPEFMATHRFLRTYVQVRSRVPAGQELNLPPPPRAAEIRVKTKRY